MPVRWNIQQLSNGVAMWVLSLHDFDLIVLASPDQSLSSPLAEIGKSRS